MTYSRMGIINVAKMLTAPKLFCKVNEMTIKIPLGFFNREKHKQNKNSLVPCFQIFFYRHYSIIKTGQKDLKQKASLPTPTTTNSPLQKSNYS